MEKIISDLGSTIFSFDGNDFIRTDTTLITEDGKSAVGTKLDHNNAGYKALIQKKSYSGEVTLFGKNYYSNYAPLIDNDGKLIGALNVFKDIK
jgi:methyl-accepting chemotaxis protein-2 (aspartate sensor receptor)